VNACDSADREADTCKELFTAAALFPLSIHSGVPQKPLSCKKNDDMSLFGTRFAYVPVSASPPDFMRQCLLPEKL
jgi:hypothetical protein